MFHSANCRGLVRIALTTTFGLAAGMTLLLLLQARRTRPAPAAVTFEQLAKRNEHYAG